MKERTIQLIEAIAEAGKPTTSQELVSATGLPQATVYRQVAELVTVGWVEKSGQGLQLGRRLLQLILAGQETAQLKIASAAPLAALVSATGETAFVARYINRRVELFDCLLPKLKGKAAIYPPLGDRPLHACSASKSILAFLPRTELEALLKGDFERFTDCTLTSKEILLDEMLAIRAAGFAQCVGEEDPDLASYAVPVRVLDGIVTFSIGIIGPRQRMMTHSVTETIAELKTAAQTMAQALVSNDGFGRAGHLD